MRMRRPTCPRAAARLAVLGAALLLGAGAARGADPELAAAGSLLVPGLGQAANGEYGYGALHLGTYAVLVNNYLTLRESDDYIEPDDRIDEENHLIRTNRTTFLADLTASAAFNLSLYSSFGAYRDARLAAGNRGYLTPAPRESLGELALSPFRWEFLSRPTTFVPLLLPLYFALSEPDDDRFLYEPDDTITRDEMAAGFFVQHNMVATGEESFFRGVLNNGLSDRFGNFYGLLGSSLLFGLAHQGNPGQATPAGAAVAGLYLGWLQQSNDFQIGQGVAIHFWWNFLISVGMLAQRDTEEQQVNLFTYATRF